MISVRFTETAERRLDDIAEWTVEKFGFSQRDRYASELIAAINALAAGEKIGRPCAVLAPRHPRAETLFYIRAGQHYVIYWLDGGEIEILDILHGASDLSARLAALDEDDAETPQ